MKHKTKLRVKPFFRWYDMWVGAHVDRDAGAVYICPLPMLGVRIWREQVYEPCHICGGKVIPVAFFNGNRWRLMYDCEALREHIGEEIPWPFEGRLMTASDLQQHGYTVI